MPTRHGPSAAVPAVPHRLSRRSFLRIGALSLGGLTLPGLLRVEAAAGVRSSHKSVILIYLVGGPPHQDMFDLKPGAPKEVAGPWKPTATNVTGIQICEALPRLARIMDKLVVVRSLVGNQADHDAIQVYNGHHPRKPIPSGGWPQLGSAVAERYGTGDPKVFMDSNGAPRVPQSLLLARRLVEAGARVVTLNYSKWDWHGGKNVEGRADNSIFLREAEDFPVFDRCVSALVEDLHQRGLDKDYTVVALGEFGRTPKISAQVGRDHWPQVNCALLAGGGMKTGQVVGATDRIAGEAVSRPVTFGELYATLYRNLGIEANATTIQDLNGRPHYLVEDQAKALP